MKKALTFILLLTAGVALSQEEVYRDAGLRTYLNMDFKLHKKLYLCIEQQNRWDNNISNYKRGSIDLGITYRINKNFRLRPAYVFIQNRNRDGYFIPRHWYGMSFIYKGEVRRWKFLYRNLFQVRNGYYEGRPARLYDRNKFTLKYEATKRLTPYTALELYVPLNSPQASGIDRTRTFAGIEITTVKNQQLELFFMFQQWHQNNRWFDYKDKYPDRWQRQDFIYGISYTFSF